MSKNVSDAVAQLPDLILRLTNVVANLETRLQAVEANVSSKPEPEKVTVYRYVRRSSRWLFDNMSGATIRFDIDYGARVVRAIIAICADSDNFSKSLGREIVNSTAYNYTGISFSADKIDSESGLVPALISVLRDQPRAALTDNQRTLLDRVRTGEWDRGVGSV